MKRPGRVTRKQKEMDAIKRAAQGVVGDIEFDKKGAIIEAALAALEKRKDDTEEEPVEKEKIVLDLPTEDLISGGDDEPLTDEEIKKLAFTTSIKEDEKEKYYTVDAFEKNVLDVEGVVVIVRATHRAKILRYPHHKKINGSSLGVSLLSRLYDTSDDYSYEIPGYDTDSEMTVDDIIEVQKVLRNKAAT